MQTLSACQDQLLVACKLLPGSADMANVYSLSVRIYVYVLQFGYAEPTVASCTPSPDRENKAHRPVLPKFDLSKTAQKGGTGQQAQVPPTEAATGLIGAVSQNAREVVPDAAMVSTAHAHTACKSCTYTPRCSMQVWQNQ